MVVPIQIDDPDDPRLADYASLKDAGLRADEGAGRRGVFNTEGEVIVRILAESRFPMRSVLMTPNRVAGLADVLEKMPGTAAAYMVSDAVMQRLVGFQFHRGVLGCGERIAGPGFEEVAGASRALVVLEGLTNAENVGAAFRNTAALAGAGSAVLLSPSCCDPFYRKAVRVSMGHVLRVPFARVEPWPGGLGTLRELGFTVIALTPDPGARDIRTIEPGEVARPALVLGTEGAGLSEGAFGEAGLRVRIPISAGVDSLNISVACGVALSRLVEPR
ncbi:putative tRNA/rRNA methyltransferase YfiF [Phycisphaerales bacterium]|nr:putative tRNA/rRNA methyltransferase YfiF [Phycisphaerales bacterium]